MLLLLFLEVSSILGLLNMFNILQNCCWFFLELLGDILDKKPVLKHGIDAIIVVDNVPIVGQDRLEKLKNVIKKVFSKFGKIVNEFYPEENGKTKGWVAFSSPVFQFISSAFVYQVWYKWLVPSTF